MTTSSSREESWPDELDALVAAPQHHTLLFENEFVRVLDTRIAPGIGLQCIRIGGEACSTS